MAANKLGMLPNLARLTINRVAPPRSVDIGVNGVTQEPDLKKQKTEAPLEQRILDATNEARILYDNRAYPDGAYLQDLLRRAYDLIEEAARDGVNARDLLELAWSIYERFELREELPIGFPEPPEPREMPEAPGPRGVRNEENFGQGQPPDDDSDSLGGKADGYSYAGGFSAAQAAEDIAELSKLDLDEGADEAAPQAADGPAGATQLEGMKIEEGAGPTIRKLLKLRGDVVKLLREVRVDEPLTMDMRQRALELRELLRPFMRLSEAARRMSGAISELLLLQVADGGGPSGTAPGAGGPRAGPGPDASGLPDAPRIVGRATDVDGSTHRHSFLLFTPPRTYEWLTELGMRENGDLRAILDAYKGPKGDDPSGNGFVVAVVAARGPAGRRQYRVRWTVDEDHVPVKYAEAHEDDWLLRRQLVNPELAIAFDRPQRDEDSSSDEEGDGADGEEARTALKWSPAQGRPLLSMRRAVAQHGGAHLGALWEYTASRLFALRCRVPPAPDTPGAPTEAELIQMGKDLYEVDSKALDAAFRRERAQEARERLRTAGGDAAEELEEDDTAALAAWREEREGEMRLEAEARWNDARVQDAPDKERLEAQLEAIEALEDMDGDAVALITTPERWQLLSDAAVDYVWAWSKDPNSAAAQISQPRIRLPKIRDVLSQPSRSAVADGWLKLLRDVHSKTKPSARLASAYGPSWPRRPGPSATPPDHVVAIRSLRMGSGLVIEHGDPAQNPANLALCTLSQNSAKADSALGLFSAPGEAQGASGQDVYSPEGVSDAKRAMLAKAVAMVFALYWGARRCHALL
tara:strand:+ start:13560 stop:15986 length:2427 start_codon:yes stop_codon:yes gene_type:complete